MKVSRIIFLFSQICLFSSFLIFLFRGLAPWEHLYEIVSYHASLPQTVENFGKLWPKVILLIIIAFDIECLMEKRFKKSQNSPFFSISRFLCIFSRFLTMHSIFSRMFGRFLGLISRIFIKIIWQHWLQQSSLQYTYRYVESKKKE